MGEETIQGEFAEGPVAMITILLNGIRRRAGYLVKKYCWLSLAPYYWVSRHDHSGCWSRLYDRSQACICGLVFCPRLGTGAVQHMHGPTLVELTKIYD
ncbi:MAG: hypothetical protein ACI9WC_002503 [Arenicella sp.]|jgi:hypothetical protein